MRRAGSTDAPSNGRPDGSRRSGDWRSPWILVAVLGLSALAFYLWRYPTGSFHVAIGSDTPVYVWWARLAGAEGLGTSGPGGRPLTVGTLAALAGATGLPVATMAAVLGPVLATSLGLAAGALVHVSLGRDDLRFGLATVFTVTFAVLLVPGYFSTLAFGTLFLAALTVLAAGPRERSRWSAAVPAILLGAAVAAHPIFLLLGAAILAAEGVALVPAWRRDAARGVPPLDRGLARIGLAALGGAAVALAALAAVSGSGRPSIDTSRDALLRRVGLDDLVVDSYRRRLRAEWPWYRAVAVPVLALGPLAVAWVRGRGSPPEARSDAAMMFRGAMAGWLALAAAGVAALLAGAQAPGQRMAAFCLALPLLAAVALRRLPRALHRHVHLVVGAGAAVWVLVGWLGWRGQAPLVPAAAVDQARAAGTALGRLPPGTPLVVIADPPIDKPGFEVARVANYVRGGVPPSRVVDVHVFVGTVEDLLAGRPTMTAAPEHDRLAEESWDAVEPLLARSPLVVAMAAFDPLAFHDVLALPEAAGRLDQLRLGRGVVAVPGLGAQRIPPTGHRLPDRLVEPGAGPFSPWTPVWLGLVVLALFGLLGAPWGGIAAGRLGPLASVALWPAFGLASLGLSAVVADAVGLRLAGSGGPVAVGLSAAAGIAVWWAHRARRTTPGGPPGAPAPRPPGHPLRSPP